MQSFFLFLKVLKPVEAEAATNQRSRLMKMDKIKGSLCFQREMYFISAAGTGIKMFDGRKSPLLEKGSEIRKAVY